MSLKHAFSIELIFIQNLFTVSVHNCDFKYMSWSSEIVIDTKPEIYIIHWGNWKIYELCESCQPNDWIQSSSE